MCSKWHSSLPQSRHGPRKCCSRDHLETASALKSAAQAWSRAAKPRKSIAQACITVRKTARSNFVAALRSRVQLGISVLFAFAFVVFFVSVVDVACVSLVLGFSVVSASDVCRWCSCLFRCFLSLSCLLLLACFCNVGRGNVSKVLFQSAARNRRSKLLFEVTGLCSAGLGHPSLCSPLLHACICTGSH